MYDDRWKNQVDIGPTHRKRKNMTSSYFFSFLYLQRLPSVYIYIYMCVYVRVNVYVVVCLRLARSFYMKLCACPFTAAAVLWHIVM